MAQKLNQLQYIIKKKSIKYNIYSQHKNDTKIRNRLICSNLAKLQFFERENHLK